MFLAPWTFKIFEIRGFVAPATIYSQFHIYNSPAHYWRLSHANISKWHLGEYCIMTKISCLSTWNPTLTKYLFPPELSLQTPHRENNLSAVRQAWLSVMDRSGAKRERDKVCVFHNNNFSVWGWIFFFSFKVLNRCPSNFWVICTHKNIHV